MSAIRKIYIIFTFISMAMCTLAQDSSPKISDCPIVLPIVIDAARVAYLSHDLFLTVSDFKGNNHTKIFKTSGGSLAKYRGKILAAVGSEVVQYSPNEGIKSFLSLPEMRVMDMKTVDDDLVVVLTDSHLVLSHRLYGIRNPRPFFDISPVSGRVAVNKSANSIVCSINGETVCYDMNGDYKWAKPGPFFAMITPLIADTGEIVVANVGGHLINCYSNSGDLKWTKIRSNKGNFNGCIFSGSYVTGGPEGVEFYDLGTGLVVRRHRTATPTSFLSTDLGVLAVCSGSVYLMRSNGTIDWLTDLPRGSNTYPFETGNAQYGIVTNGPVLTTIDVK